MNALELLSQVPPPGEESPLRKIFERLALLEAEVIVLKALRVDMRRLPIAAAAKEFGFSLAEMDDLIEADAVVLCNATTRPRVAMAETDRLLREKFHLIPRKARQTERKAA